MDRYEEALERAKMILCNLPEGSSSTRDIETIFPELKESEDERIRKELIGMINECTNWPHKKEYVKYLKKQKEYVSDNFDDVWTTEDCKEIIEEGKKLSPRFKELFKEVCHAWYDKGIELEKRKEQKPHLELKAGKWYICHRAYCARADDLTVKEGERFQCEKDGIVKGFVIKEPEKYFMECSAPAPMEKEQNPADLSELMVHKEPYIAPVPTPIVADEQKPVERVEINKSLSDAVITELSKYNGENYWESPWAIDSTGLQYPLYFANLGATWQKEQNPAEWSEEDERMLSRCLKSIECSKQFSDSDTFKIAKDKEISWLKDLCARLPYRVLIERKYIDCPTGLHEDDLVSWKLDEISTKPYLRPMSSMTGKEETEWHELTFGQRWITFDNVGRCVDWLNSHHFDYRGLIEKELALEAPEGMYDN